MTVGSGQRAVVADTRPYAWPWDGRIDASTMALVVVRAPGPAPDSTDPERRLLQLFDTAKAVGVLSVQVRSRDPRGAAPAGGADGLEYDETVVAAGWNGFGDSGLDPLLRRAGRTHLLIAGDFLEIGVHSTMRAANDMGYECLLLEDAVTPADPQLVAAALSTIEMSGGIFGAVGRADAVRTALSATT